MKILAVPKNPSEAVFAKTKEFLLQNEKKCVSLCDRIFHHEVKYFLIVEDFSGQQKTDFSQSQILGVFSYSDGGQILHFFSKIEENRVRYKNLLVKLFEKFDFSKLFSIIGETEGTNLLMNGIYSAQNRIPFSSRNYDFMELPDSSFDFVPIQNKTPNLKIEKADMILLEMLKPIQKAYEEEEVLCEGQEFNSLVSTFLLKKTLNAKNVFVATMENKILGKASLNAESENFSQIGGVYTVPEFRGLGIGNRLVRKVISEKKSQGKKIVLFVKTENLPAQKLYENCGFRKFGKFKICYY